MNSVENGLAAIGRVESTIHLFVFGFIGIVFIGFGIDALIKEERMKKLQQQQQEQKTHNVFHPYILMIIGFLFLGVAYGNYYLTQKSTAFAAFEGAEDIARIF